MSDGWGCADAVARTAPFQGWQQHSSSAAASIHCHYHHGSTRTFLSHVVIALFSSFFATNPKFLNIVFLLVGSFVSQRVARLALAGVDSSQSSSIPCHLRSPFSGAWHGALLSSDTREMGAF